MLETTQISNCVKFKVHTGALPLEKRYLSSKITTYPSTTASESSDGALAIITSIGWDAADHKRFRTSPIWAELLQSHSRKAENHIQQRSSNLEWIPQTIARASAGFIGYAAKLLCNGQVLADVPIWFCWMWAGVWMKTKQREAALWGTGTLRHTCSWLSNTELSINALCWF